MEHPNVIMNWNKVRLTTPNDKKKIVQVFGGKDTENLKKKDKTDENDLSLSEILANSLRKEYPQNE